MVAFPCNISEWWLNQWWHVPIILLILLSTVVVMALLITSFYTIHKVNYLSEDLQEMDETFLKTLSEHDRDVLEQCVRISYQQTKDQVSKLWSIYIKKEEMMKKRREEEEIKLRAVTASAQGQHQVDAKTATDAKKTA